MLQQFRTAPPSRQLALIALTGAGLCVLLALAYFLWFRTSYAVLFSDLRPADAATIVAELDRTHADYRLGDGGRTILVPAGAVDSTRVHVAGQDLPLQGTVGFELFNNSSIGLTEFAQRINLQRALQGELARTIMDIDGVDSARVHLSLGEQSIFRGDRRPPRASVAIRTTPGHALNAMTVRGIQRLVAGSVTDLEAGDVAVLNDRGVLVSADAPDDAAAASGSPEERSVERFFETRIRRALEARYPADAVEATVWAALDPAAAAPAEDSLATERNFRLRATVAIASPLSDAAHRQVTQAVEDAIGFNAPLGDAVTVTAAAPIPAAADWSQSWSQAQGAAPAAAAATPPRFALDYLWTPLALLLVAGIAFLAVRRRARGAALLGESDRLAYVAQLKTLLAQRSADAAPPL